MICLILFSLMISLMIFASAYADSTEELGLVLSDDLEETQITKVTFDGRYLKIYYNYTNISPGTRSSNMLFDVRQNDIACERYYEGSHDSFTEYGTSIESCAAYYLNNTSDFVTITAHIMLKDEYMSFYFDPIIQKTSLEYNELIWYREADMPQMLFAEKRLMGEPVSYGIWANVDTFFNRTYEYEFFSNGSCRRTIRPSYNDGVTYPGIYKVTDNTLEMYCISDYGNFDHMTFEISENARIITNVNTDDSYEYTN